MPNRAKIKMLGLNGPEETLHGVKSRWFRIEYQEAVGWMIGGFVKMIQEDPRHESVIGIIDILDGMKLRQGPGAQSGISRRSAREFSCCTGVRAKNSNCRGGIGSMQNIRNCYEKGCQ